MRKAGFQPQLRQACLSERNERERAQRDSDLFIVWANSRCSGLCFWMVGYRGWREDWSVRLCIKRKLNTPYMSHTQNWISWSKVGGVSQVEGMSQFKSGMARGIIPILCRWCSLGTIQSAPECEAAGIKINTFKSFLKLCPLCRSLSTLRSSSLVMETDLVNGSSVTASKPVCVGEAGTYFEIENLFPVTIHGSWTIHGPLSRSTSPPNCVVAVEMVPYSSPGRLSLEIYQEHSTGWRPQGRPRTCSRELTVGFGTSRDPSRTARIWGKVKKFWTDHLSLLPLWSPNGQVEGKWMNECLERETAVHIRTRRRFVFEIPLRGVFQVFYLWRSNDSSSHSIMNNLFT